MAIDAQSTFANTNNAAFPDTESVNASGPTATDGTEFVKAMIDNYMFGPQQALLEYGGLTPNGLSEEAGSSQELQAMQRSFGHPGEMVGWFGNNDPAALGLRVLVLQGQGVLAANYPDLVSAVYVGDPDNATAEAFYRADDAAGTIRNTVGAYLILPDARGLSVRSIDETGLVDPDGATRLPGDTQQDAMQTTTGFFDIMTSNVVVIRQQGGAFTGPNGTQTDVQFQNVVGVPLYNTQRMQFNNANSVSPNPAKTNDDETRAKNISVKLAIRY